MPLKEERIALRQTYLSMKKELPPDAEAVLVMRGRGNDELAPSKELLDEVNGWKARFEPGQGYDTPYHFAWAKTDFAERFAAKVRDDEEAMARLRELSERAEDHDVFLVCYEGYDKPCHRNLLLQIAEADLGAKVDPEPFLP